jgi:hypothetical protein
MYNIYSSPDIIRMIILRRIRWKENVTCMAEKMNACRILVGKQERNRPVGRPRYRWKDNIKVKVRYDGMVWTGLIWLRMGTGVDMNIVRNFWIA